MLFTAKLSVTNEICKPFWHAVCYLHVKKALIKQHIIMSEFSDIIRDKKPTLVDFYATWCGPCKMQAPILDQVKQTVGDEANILKIDVDRNPELAQQYRVQSIPTLIMFVEGEAVWRGYGLHQADQLVAKVKEFQTLKSDIGKL